MHLAQNPLDLRPNPLDSAQHYWIYTGTHWIWFRTDWIYDGTHWIWSRSQETWTGTYWIWRKTHWIDAGTHWIWDEVTLDTGEIE